LHNKTWIPLAACALSIALWFFFNLILGALPLKYSIDSPYGIYHTFKDSFGNKLSWWITAIIGILIVVGFNLGVTAWQRVFYPTDRNLWQEIEKHDGIGQVVREYNIEEGQGALANHGVGPSDEDASSAQKPRDL
jgi:phospholipid-translocating ATPase